MYLRILTIRFPIAGLDFVLLYLPFEVDMAEALPGHLRATSIILGPKMAF